MLSLRNVSRVYREGSVVVPALTDVDLDIGAERFTMIVGPSGSGKTTLLNLIGTIDRPTTGTITIEGQDVGALCDRALTAFRAARIGFIFQAFNLLPMLSALENVEYGLLLAQVPAAARRARALEALEAVGLSAQLRQRPSQLSGGQRQRVAIARALAKRPALVLADEPTANLDSHNGAAIVALMREMQRRYRMTFIFSTHDGELMKHADELVTTHDGKVHQSTLAPAGAAAAPARPGDALARRAVA